MAGISGARIVLSSLTGLGLQLVTYGLGWLAGGSVALPQPAISIGSTWTSIIISLIGRLLGPGVASLSWLPTLVNLVAGWLILGLAVLGLIAMVGKIFTGILIIVIIALLAVLVFGVHLPIITLPTNSTLPH